MTLFAEYLTKATQGHVFTQQEMSLCISLLMHGEAEPAQAAQFLTALANRGETPEEIAGAARALRELCVTIDAPANAIDCCGTGGDGAYTYNISTTVALVAAACGVPVAKHGNRSSSSKCGAADVLEQLGVNLDLPTETLERALRELNFCFLMAPLHHAAMKNVAPVRRELGFRTIFNLLGPLASPAGTKKQLIGVYDRKWVLPVAQALQALGADRALIVHGSDGLDEITLTGKTYAAYFDGKKIIEETYTPDDFGLNAILMEDIRGGDAQTNAAALLDVLNGKKSAYRDMVCANTAAVLFLHDGRNFKQGVKDAAAAIDSGKALSVLTHYKDFK
jgi:anthranilate phosphoribosyltransferase